MRPPYPLLLASALSACMVEPTPDSFYDQRDPAVVELQEAEGEIRARVINFLAELSRGDTAAALTALNPTELVQVMGPAAPDSLGRLGRVGLREAMGLVRLAPNSVAVSRDLRVGAGQGMGWFATHVDLLPVVAGGRAERLRMSGVFVRERGAWRLVHAHFAQAESVATAPPPSPGPVAAPEEGG